MCELFQSKFPDYDIVKTFQLGPNKVKYFASFGLKPRLTG